MGIYSALGPMPATFAEGSKYKQLIFGRKFLQLCHPLLRHRKYDLRDTYLVLPSIHGSLP